MDHERVGLFELYKYYRSYSGVKSEDKLTEEEKLKIKYRYQIDRWTYSKILWAFNREIMRRIIEESADFKMPGNVGKIRVRKYKKRLRLNRDIKINGEGKCIDWNRTNKLWNEVYPDRTKEELKKIKDKPLVFYLNEHTDGYVFKFFWDKTGIQLRNKVSYSTSFTRTNKRWLAEVLKTNDKINYYE